MASRTDDFVSHHPVTEGDKTLANKVISKSSKKVVMPACVGASGFAGAGTEIIR